MAEARDVASESAHIAAESAHILVINGGSSSIKLAVYERLEDEQSASQLPPLQALSARVERIGSAEATLTISFADSRKEHLCLIAADHATALRGAMQLLRLRNALPPIVGVGHRIVHGGPRFSAPEIVTVDLLEELRRISSLDPAHLPAEIALIEVLRHELPEAPQVACFDTAFHHDMPRVAQLLPIPRRYEKAGLRRYGFHGLSYTYLMQELRRLDGDSAARGRVILCHLGNGASLAAVSNGACLDTSMGLTPTAGLVMGTRSGDIDPGLVGYLSRTEALSPEGFDQLANRECGLLGISETSSDMRDLLAREATDERAAEAVALFCYQARKWIGSYVAVLGGLDTLVFAGGIGENAIEVRSRICDGLGFLGIKLEPDANRENSAAISSEASRVKVRVIRTDEESVIAQAVWELLTSGAARAKA